MTKHKCRYKCESLQSYLDGELPFVEQHQIEMHLEHCSQCAERLTQIQNEQQEIRATLNLYPRIKASPDFNLRVLESLEFRQQKQNTLLDFCDKWDAIFARPILRLFASSAFGLFGGLILVSALMPGGTKGITPNIATRSPQVAVSSPEHNFSRMAQIYGHDFSWDTFEQEQNTPRRKEPSHNDIERRSRIPARKEKQWNAILPSKNSDLVSSSLHGSLC